MLKFMRYVKKDITDLQNGDVQSYKTFQQKQGLSAKTINAGLRVFSIFLRYLEQEQQFTLPINKKIKYLKVQQQQFLNHYISKSDFERLIRATDRKQDIRAKALIYTFYYTGARLSEVLNLPSSAINQDSVTIWGKGKKSRALLIPKKLQRVWQEYIEACPQIKESKFLFPGRWPEKHLSNSVVHTTLKYYAGQARLKKMNVHPHSFRHGYAVQLDKQGFTLTEIADLLGHADINMTRIYQKRTEQEIRDKLNKVL